MIDRGLSGLYLTDSRVEVRSAAAEARSSCFQATDNKSELR